MENTPREVAAPSQPSVVPRTGENIPTENAASSYEYKSDQNAAIQQKTGSCCEFDCCCCKCWI